MSILEIIHLRSSIEPIDALTDRIRESIWAEGHGTDVVTLYRRHGLGPDVAVHIRYRGEGGVPGSSSLAVHLAQALKAYGLVEHSVWEEINDEVSSCGHRNE
ncbi:MAG: hypothetical protein P8Y93_06310 [Acidobacteriota bacterium]